MCVCVGLGSGLLFDLSSLHLDNPHLNCPQFNQIHMLKQLKHNNSEECVRKADGFSKLLYMAFRFQP